MAYANVDKTNLLYQPRENIKQLLLDNISTPGVKIYSYYPDVKGTDFTGFPFIVIPEFDADKEDGFFGTSVMEYSGEVEGSIFHDISKLGDNRLRQIKSDVLTIINKKTNWKSLEAYNQHDLKVVFDSSPLIPSVQDQKELQVIPMTFSFSSHIDFG